MEKSSQFFNYEMMSLKKLHGSKRIISNSIDKVISNLNGGSRLLPHQNHDVIRINKLRKEILSISEDSNLLDHIVSIAFDELIKNNGRTNHYFHQLDEIIRDANNNLPSSRVTVTMNMITNFDDAALLPGIKKFSGDNPVLYAYMFQKIADYKHDEIDQNMKIALFNSKNNYKSPEYIDCLLEKEAIRRMERKVRTTISGFKAAFKLINEYDSKSEDELQRLEERESEIKEMTGGDHYGM